MIGNYICFEGIDGSGKSSQLELLAAQLFAAGTTPIKLCEPSYGPFGREVRRRMSGGTIGGIAAQRELFTADRLDHVSKKIEPLLRFVRQTPGFAILQSRSYLSAPAYQSEGMDHQVLKERVKIEAAITPAPDSIVILDIPVDAALKRLTSDRRPDLFEDSAKLELVRERYRYLAQLVPQCVVIDAFGEQKDVNERIRKALGLLGRG